MQFKTRDVSVHHDNSSKHIPSDTITTLVILIVIM